jgi:hypothetical protein
VGVRAVERCSHAVLTIAAMAVSTTGIERRRADVMDILRSSGCVEPDPELAEKTTLAQLRGQSEIRTGRAGWLGRYHPRCGQSVLF